MTEQHPEAQAPNALGSLNRLRAAYAAGKADRLAPGHPIEATMLEVGLLLQMIDNQIIVASAVEMMGASDGWNAAVSHTARQLGPAGDGYLAAMLRGNPYTAQGEMLMRLASEKPAEGPQL